MFFTVPGVCKILIRKRVIYPLKQYFYSKTNTSTMSITYIFLNHKKRKLPYKLKQNFEPW